MNYNFGKCLLPSETMLEIKVEEEGKSFKIRNPSKKEILKVRVDKCLKFEGFQCDWLLVLKESDSAFYVELKGSDPIKAINQLANSIKQVVSVKSLVKEIVMLF